MRSIIPEANITLDGYQYTIGGVYGISNTQAYLNRSSIDYTVDPNAFVYTGYSLTVPKEQFHWEPGLRFSPKDGSWPPKGLQLQVNFKPPLTVRMPSHSDVTIALHYEMYQGVPIMAKWVSVNYTDSFIFPPIRIDAVMPEILATQKPFVPLTFGTFPRPWERGDGILASWLYVETDQAHGTKVEWINDPQMGLSPGADEPILITSYSSGPSVLMANIPNDSLYLTQFNSFRVIELVTDSYDRERVGLSRHRLTRLLKPQTQESPIFFHSTNNTPNGSFNNAIDQMVNVGFEMLIYSFHSGFNMENISDVYLEIIKKNVDYAKSNGIEVGG